METTSSIYMNNAASSWPKAPGVAEAVANDLAALPQSPGRCARAQTDALWACRTRLARLLGVEDLPERIVLTQHATHALNLSVLGLGLKQGDAVVTSITEHNSVLRPLARMEDALGLNVGLIGLTEDGCWDEESFDQMLQRKPRLVVLNHVSNVTGRIQSIAPLFARARKAGAVTLLDASQSLGHLEVNARAMNADLVAFTGHKGLRGPTGTGGLFVDPRVELDQVFVGGTGVRSDLRLHPTDMPTRLEAGTPNSLSLAGLAAALRWQEEEGKAFQSVEKARADQLRAGLRNIPRVQLFDDTQAPTVGIVSFRVEGWDVEETGFLLEESFGVVCRTGLHCAPLIHAFLGSAPEGTVRLSPSGVTAEADIERTLSAVRRLAA